MSQKTSSSGKSTPLRRGTACLTCRQRKIKCDGVRPICGSCSQSWPDECEYYDGGPSRSQLLEEEISVLETKLQALENPSNPPRQMTLYDPYRRAGQEGSGPGGVQPLELSTSNRRSLIRSFLSSASEFGFFLDISKFTASLSSSSPSSSSYTITTTGTYQPLDFLLSTIYLLSAYLSPIREVCSQQPRFLSKSLQDATQSLSSNHPEKVLHTVQAETLLAQYLFCNGRILEGKYHLGTAVSIAIGAGYHKIRAASDGRNTLVSPPRGPVEEGERINALWTVLAMSNCWAGTEGSESGFPYYKHESRIDAPWPMDIGGYLETPFPTSFRTSHTIQNFLASTQDNAYSLLALYAKSSILFEQASLLSQQYHPNMNLQEATQFQTSYTNITGLLKRFTSELARRPIAETETRSVVRRLMVVNTLVRVGAMKLYELFAGRDPRAQNEVFVNGEEVIGLIRSVNLGEFPFVDPIVGHLWLTTARVLINQIAGIRSRKTHMPQRYRSLREIGVLVETVISAMGVLSPHSPLIEGQIAEVQSAYNVVLH